MKESLADKAVRAFFVYRILLQYLVLIGSVKHQRKGTSASRRVLQKNFPVELRRVFLRDAKSQPEMLPVASGVIRTVEALENLFLLFIRDALAVVDYLEEKPVFGTQDF